MKAVLTEKVLVFISSEISSFELFINYSKRRNLEDFELLFKSYPLTSSIKASESRVFCD